MGMIKHYTERQAKRIEDSLLRFLKCLPGDTLSMSRGFRFRSSRLGGEFEAKRFTVDRSTGEFVCVGAVRSGDRFGPETSVPFMEVFNDLEEARRLGSPEFSDGGGSIVSELRESLRAGLVEPFVRNTLDLARDGHVLFSEVAEVADLDNRIPSGLYATSFNREGDETIVGIGRGKEKGDYYFLTSDGGRIGLADMEINGLITSMHVLAPTGSVIRSASSDFIEALRRNTVDGNPDLFSHVRSLVDMDSKYSVAVCDYIARLSSRSELKYVFDPRGTDVYPVRDRVIDLSNAINLSGHVRAARLGETLSKINDSVLGSTMSKSHVRRNDNGPSL